MQRQRAILLACASLTVILYWSRPAPAVISTPSVIDHTRVQPPPSDVRQGSSVCDDKAALARYFMPANYQTNTELTYDLDTKERTERWYQFNVYNTAAYVANQPGSNKWIIDVGCGNGRKASVLYDLGYNMYMMDWKANFESAKRQMMTTARYKRWAASGQAPSPGLLAEGLGMAVWDISGDPSPPIVPEEIVRNGVVVNADVIEHLADPNKLVNFLKSLQRGGLRAAVVSTPDRDIILPGSLRVPSRKDARFWGGTEFYNYLTCSGMAPALLEHTRECLTCPPVRRSTTVVISSNDQTLLNTFPVPIDDHIPNLIDQGKDSH